MGRIGIYGGTFNPPHAGHVEAARQAIARLKLDQLLLIPAGHPPHKDLPDYAPTAQERLELVRLAVRDIPKAQVVDLEVSREGKSYTVDTLQTLRQSYEDDQLFLLMGTDMFLSFAHWYKPDEICRCATIVVMLREKEDLKIRELLEEKSKEVREKLSGEVLFLENDILPMSSTDVRRMLTFHAQKDMVPEAVMERIRERGYYGVHQSLKGLSMEQLEQVVVALLNPNRVAHVLGCRDTAVKLAEKYGVDGTDAARAALLHDITKALPYPLQLQVCEVYRIPSDRLDVQSPKTLHATTGAWVAKEIFGENKAVVDAIDSHTSGRADMNTLQKIIYIADYMEPNRKFPGVEKLRETVAASLDEGVLMGLEMTVELLRQQGRVVSQNSLDAIRWLKENK